MAARGAFALLLLSVTLALAIGGLSHAMPKAYRAYVGVALFFPGFFVVIAVSLRFAEGRLRSVRDIFDSSREGFSFFLAWCAAMIGVAAAGGLLALIFG